MKIIIDIPKETYNHVCDIYNRLPTPEEEIQIENAIRNATILNEDLEYKDLVISLENAIDMIRDLKEDLKEAREELRSM